MILERKQQEEEERQKIIEEHNTRRRAASAPTMLQQSTRIGPQYKKHNGKERNTDMLEAFILD